MGHVITLSNGENVIVGNDENFLDSKYFEVIEETLGYEFRREFIDAMENYYSIDEDDYVTMSTYRNLNDDYEELQYDYDKLSYKYDRLLEELNSLRASYEPITPF
jgi:hypothetical protein